MTRLAQTALRNVLTAGHSCRPGLIHRLRRSFARTTAAMEGQARLSAVAIETLRDTRLSPEELTGALTYDPALPFFLQSGFGRSDH
ncbi:hypothetical protein OU426_02225 [Frigidibacter sp. RF13]|uniref:hypothetical protein n=1 Tax=Frigidibacter sp. RF13 TaxID=2997340 RepID=UPI002271BCD8|nr:hypothetical protein [Frigidibacter sp. RF13]MCY1125658.1 hypothetical protein [Frigidibacter sp. RF13]